MDNLEMNLKVLLILGFSLGLLAVVNSSSDYHEQNDTSILVTYEQHNRSSEGHAANFQYDILPTVATTTGIYTHTLLGNLTGLSSTSLPLTNLEIVVGASVPTIHEHQQKSTTKDPPQISDKKSSIQHSQNETVTTMKSFVSPKDSEVHKTKELSIDITTSKGQNEENSDLFANRQDKSALIDYEQQGVNVFSTFVVTPTLSLSTSSELSDLSIHNLSSYDNTISTLVDEAARNSTFTLKSELVTEPTPITFENQKTINQNFSEPTDANILIENRTVMFKNDEEYTVIVPRICSNNSIISRLLYLLNASPNSKRKADFTCEKLKDMKISLNSEQLFDKVSDFLKSEAKTDDMVFIKVGPNATLSFEILPQASFDGIFIPMFTVIIIGNLLLWLLLIISCVCLYKKFCRRHSTSLDLHQIPHLNLKADYNLTPIPRPSISFPDSNRDFLHAYTHDNYNRSRQENTLNKRNGSCAMAKTYEEVDKEIRSKQEMSTFTMSSGRKSEFKVSTSQDYASSHSWDRLQEKNYPKKHGIDNSGYRKW